VTFRFVVVVGHFVVVVVEYFVVVVVNIDERSPITTFLGHRRPVGPLTEHYK
jgi:hypothetical protein